MLEEQVVFQVSAHPRWSQGKLAAGMPHSKSVIERLKPEKKLKNKYFFPVIPTTGMKRKIKCKVCFSRNKMPAPLAEK